MHAGDPRLAVEAPIRRAVAGIARQGLAGSVLAFLALGAMVGAGLPAAVHEAVAVGLPILLLAYAALVAASRALRGPIPAELAAHAWRTAREVDPENASFARMLASWTPVAILLCLAISFWSHVAGQDSFQAGPWWLVGLPAYGTAWLLATLAWGDACRTAIARAERAADERFRSYWSHPAG